MDDYEAVCDYLQYEKSIGSHTKKQIATLLHTDSSGIKIHMINTQRQTGGSDCGLFAIAFATAIAIGLQPEDYCFNQTKMREHLIRCLEAGKIEVFPYSRPRRRVNRAKATFSVPIYCSCRMPDVFKAAWIECTKCKTWYHSGTCAKVRQEVLRNKRSEPLVLFRLCFIHVARTMYMYFLFSLFYLHTFDIDTSPYKFTRIL